ncbi:MAG: CDP-diacylglycerol--glycerol-3-phosphate 3-phosphatidyltransferase, partial [Pseudomonadota bacterium]
PLALTIPTTLIVGRDLGVTVLRFLPHIELPVTRLAKVKTALELVGIGGVLLAVALAGGLETPQLSGILTLAWLAIWMAALLSAWTGLQYIRTAFRSTGHQK